MRQFVILTAAVLVSYTAGALSTSDIDGLAVGTGWGGWWYSSGDLIVVDCATGQKTTIVNGSCYGACFSPDGTQIAYFKNENSIWICNLDGSGDHQVTSNTGYSSESHSNANWIADDWIYWGAGNNLKRCKTDGSQRNDNVHIAGYELLGFRVSHDGSRAAGFAPGWHVERFYVGGSSKNLGGGCQGSVSRNGQYVTHNLDHTHFRIHNFGDGSEAKYMTALSGDSNNHAFSHMSDDYLVYTLKENSGKGVVCQWHANVHKHVASGLKLWDYNPSPPSSNTVRIDSFSASPSTITQGSSATLSWNTTNATTVTIDQSIGGVSGDGSRSVSPSTTTTYTLTANGDGGPVTQSVTVTVNVPQVSIDSFGASPGTIADGESSTLSWNTSNASTVTIDNGVGTVSGDGSTSVSPSSTTTYTITAEGAGGPKTATATVIVMDPGSLHLKLDCGTGSPVSGWVKGDDYVTDGSDYGSLPTPSNLGGLSNPAPAGLYNSCRHGADHTYEIAVPNGTYHVRIHFNDHTDDSRNMTYKIEGATVLSNYDPPNAAEIKEYANTVVGDGGLTIQAIKGSGNDVFECGIEVIGGGGTVTPVLTSIVVTPSSASITAGDSQSFSAQPKDQSGDNMSATVNWSVSGGGSLSQGSGASTTFNSDGSDGTFTITASSGAVSTNVNIVVSPSGSPTPASVQINPGTATIAADGTQSLSAVARDGAGAIINDATFAWTATGGSVNPSTGTSVTFTPDGPGAGVITATSQGVSGSATITVTAVPIITITEPAAGDVWYIGTTRRIKWSTTNMDDVTIYYSVDGGTSGELINFSIQNTQPGWGDLAWDISPSLPSLPSTNCQIVITAYSGEYPTLSGVFEIRDVTDTDGDGMDDGWETDHLGDLSSDGSGDADDDGISDLDEFLYGTDPGVADGDGNTLMFSCAGGSASGAGFLSLVLAFAAITAALGASRRFLTAGIDDVSR